MPPPAGPDGPIDLHSHVVPGAFPARAGAPAGWPAMAPAGPGQRHVMIDGRIYRTVGERCWDVPARLAWMAARGLARQAICPMPELFSYWLPAEPAAELVAFINDDIARMVGEAEGRLIGLGAVPLQAMDLALAELRRLRALGFAGVEIGSNVNGASVAGPDFEPFFAAAAALGMAVLVHPVRPTGMDRVVGGEKLEQALGYPSEIGLAGAAFVTSGLLARHPALRLCLSHGGGTLAALLPRLEQACRTFPALGESLPDSPTALARRLYLDTLVFDAPLLRLLLEGFGAERLMLGTDAPFAFREDDPVGRLTALLPPGAAREAILAGTARHFLGLA
ncbi:amidohydrolase [Roseomonas sp. GC11]|uniref:amidohydrolase family protein n=1 Tax=Roseomonas sp. GC11 TaxID=2950546 RepID=UPI00210C1EBD|nr:amidohydrolase family protein [Roseomonas sp. GC11]MCQ4158616.1 amidohydrolase [Roseomonas sp. GC11]